MTLAVVDRFAARGTTSLILGAERFAFVGHDLFARRAIVKIAVPLVRVVRVLLRGHEVTPGTMSTARNRSPWSELPHPSHALARNPSSVPSGVRY